MPLPESGDHWEGKQTGGLRDRVRNRGAPWGRLQRDRPPAEAVTQVPPPTAQGASVLRPARQVPLDLPTCFPSPSYAPLFLHPFPLVVMVLTQSTLANTQPESCGKSGALGSVALATTGTGPHEAAASPDRLHNSRFNVVESLRRPREINLSTVCQMPFSKRQSSVSIKGFSETIKCFSICYTVMEVMGKTKPGLSGAGSQAGTQDVCRAT